MRLFRSLFPWGRRPVEDTQPPQVERLVAYIPEHRVLFAYRDAKLILAHLIRGRSASRRMLRRSGMSEARWNRAVAFMRLCGVVGEAKQGKVLELTVHDAQAAYRLLAEGRRRLLVNLQNPKYTLPFD